MQLSSDILHFNISKMALHYGQMITKMWYEIEGSRDKDWK